MMSNHSEKTPESSRSNPIKLIAELETIKEFICEMFEPEELTLVYADDREHKAAVFFEKDGFDYSVEISREEK